MGVEEIKAERAAVSGSASAARGRKAPADPDGTAILLFDSSLRVRLATGLGHEGGPLGVPLSEAIASDADGARIERCARCALAGCEVQLTVGADAEQRRSLRFVPVEGEIEGARSALVLVGEERPADAELEALRGRAGELETLASAARALARTTYGEEARQTVCEAAREVAGSEMAALLEPLPDGSALVVTAACGMELDGRSAPLDRSAQATDAFSSGKPSFGPDLACQGAATAWPLRQAGALAAVWQPVRRAVGIRGVIAFGWKQPRQPPGKRQMSSLELLADEAAVAIDRATALERMTGLARTDPLTELSNRRAWQDELRRELARAGRARQRLSIGMIDVDELKAFNDHWGHAAGDRLLLTAAARWRRRLRLTDLLARIGGDEFALTLPGCALSEAVHLGNELRAALPDGLSCSVGVAEWVAGEPPDRLLARADQALYAAKEAGRNRTCAMPAEQAGPRDGDGAGRSVVLPHLGEPQG